MRAVAERPRRLPATGHPGRRPILLAALALGAFVGMVDATIVAVALDPLSRHFGVTLAESQDVLAIYLVTVVATMPTLGRVADGLGRKRFYIGGFGVFAAGSVLAALAPSFGLLLLGRAVQAVGGGLLTSGSLALIAEHAGGRRAGRSVALLVITQAVAGLAGPPLGGLLVALWGWQSVFWVGVPLGLAGVALAALSVPGAAPGHRASVDPAGALGLAALLLGAGAAVASLGGAGVLGWPPVAWLLVAIAGAAVLALREARASEPLLDRRLLGAGRFSAAAAATFLSTGTLMSCFAFLPYWLESAHGASAAAAGAAFLPIGLGIAATARLGGALGDRGQTRTVTGAGMGVAALGMLLCAAGAASTSWPVLLGGLFVLGCGNGLFSAPNTAAAIATAPTSALGAASGFLSMARNAGVIAGLGITGAVYTAATRHAPDNRDAAAAAIFATAAAVCLAVAGVTLRLYRDVGPVSATRSRAGDAGVEALEVPG